MFARTHTWIILAALLLAGGCRGVHERVELTGTEAFRNGDLVLRGGCGAESRAVMTRSGSRFSHIGILQLDSLTGEWMVIHAVPGENCPGEPEYLKRERLSEFFDPMRARQGAWMRINCSDSIADRAARYCSLKQAECVRFDNDYLLRDTTELYCCELVWLAYLREGLDISDSARYEVPLVICKEGECIFPCNIENGSNTLFVKHFNTKRS